MEEAAMVDGANMGVTFTKIILPLVAPGIFTVAILIFINSWNNYLFAQVFNQLPKARTVTVALTLFQVDNSLPWELVSAAAVIVTVPLILVVLILQKKIISGMMDGGVKG
jgi:multiple sugar transport system permease protein